MPLNDDDIAWRECRDEELHDPSAEELAVDWSVEDVWRIDPVVAQGSQEGERVPLAEGHLDMKPLAFASAAIQVNMRGGHLPEPESNGTRYLKIPLDVL